MARNYRISALARFADKVLVGDGCWEWVGAKGTGGYGQIGNPNGPGTVKAHRAMYELMVGPIPEGLVIDHLCRNHSCVRPDHLEPVTQRENQLRGIKVQLKTHCAQGHPWVPENIVVRKRGGRHCRVCASRNHARKAA